MHGQEIERHAEQELQHERHPERRDGEAADRENAQGVVHEAVVMQGGEQPERHPEEGGERHREERQFERRGQAVEDFRRHRHLGEEADPERARAELPHIDDELLDQRLVEAVFGAQRRDLCRGGVVAGEDRRRVAWHDAHHHEDEHEQPEQDRRDLQNAADEEPEHLEP
jgi:hypothetical protein